MSGERIQSRHRRVGLGVENLVLFFNHHPDQVYKFARQLYVLRRDLFGKNSENTTENRVKENMLTLHEYVGEQFLPKTEVKSFNNIWWIQQEILPVKNYVSSKNIDKNPQLTLQIISIIEQTKVMYEKTGYYIDWFGFNRLDEILKLLTLPDYWSIPNLVINKNLQLKLFDLGLYRGISNDEKKHSTISPKIDPLLCKLHLYLIGKVEEKIESWSAKYLI